MSIPLLLSQAAAFVGVVILWFEDAAQSTAGNGIVGNFMPFINLYIAGWLLTFASIENPFVKAAYRTTLRSFGILMFFYYLPQTACLLDKARRLDDGAVIAVEAERDAIKAGMFLVIIPAVFLYVRSLFVTKAGEKREFSAVRGLFAFLFILAAAGLVVVQAIIYDDPETCKVMDTHLDPTRHLLLFFLVIAAALLSDREAGSLAIYIFAYYTLEYAPVFGANKPTSEKRQGQIIIGYVVTWIYLLFSSVYARSNNPTPAESPNLRLVSQLVLLAIGIAGAVCVYVRSPRPREDRVSTYEERFRNYFITSAIATPLLDLLALKLRFHLFTVLATIAPLVFGGTIARELFHDSVLPGHPPASGVTRTGIVLALIALYFSPVLSIAFRSEKSFRFLHESFSKKSWVYTSVAILLTYWGANRYAESGDMFFPLAYLGAVVYTSSEMGFTDGLRIALYFLARLVFFTWPLDVSLLGGGPAVFIFVIFWIGVAYSFFFAAQNADSDGFETFELVDHNPPAEEHHEEEGEAEEGAEEGAEEAAEEAGENKEPVAAEEPAAAEEPKAAAEDPAADDPAADDPAADEPAE